MVRVWEEIMFRHSRSVFQRGTRALHASSSAKSGGYVRCFIYLLLRLLRWKIICRPNLWILESHKDVSFHPRDSRLRFCVVCMLSRYSSFLIRRIMNMRLICIIWGLWKIEDWSLAWESQRVSSLVVRFLGCVNISILLVPEWTSANDCLLTSLFVPYMLQIAIQWQVLWFWCLRYSVKFGLVLMFSTFSTVCSSRRLKDDNSCLVTRYWLSLEEMGQ